MPWCTHSVKHCTTQASARTAQEMSFDFPRLKRQGSQRKPEARADAKANAKANAKAEGKPRAPTGRPVQRTEAGREKPAGTPRNGTESTAFVGQRGVQRTGGGRGRGNKKTKTTKMGCAQNHGREGCCPRTERTWNFTVLTDSGKMAGELDDQCSVCQTTVGEGLS